MNYLVRVRVDTRVSPVATIDRVHSEQESVGLGNELVRDAFAPRAQASFFYAVILDVAPALREHEDNAEHSPELEAKAMVVDQSHHDFTRSRAEPVACRESGDTETITLARPVTSFRYFRTVVCPRLLD